MFVYLLLFISLLQFQNCSSEKSFTLEKNGLQYRFQIENDSTKAKVGDILELEMKILSAEKKILFSTKEISPNFRMKLNPPSHKGGSFEDALAMMRVGEKASFLIGAENFYTFTKKEKLPENVKKGELLQFDILLKKILSKKELAQEELKIKRLKKKKENTAIFRIFKSTKNNFSPFKNRTVCTRYEKRKRAIAPIGR